MSVTRPAIEFSIDYAFSSRALEAVMGPVFGQIMETIVERFVERAARLREARSAPMPAPPPVAAGQP